jgi:Zn-dependent peptidase ImmA (M78 family)
MMRWAREQIGLSLDDFSRLPKRRHYATISRDELEHWENGEAEPGLEHLEALSEIYVCPVGYFFLAEPPKEKAGLSFRGLAAEKQERLQVISRQTLRRFADLAEWTVSLLEDAGMDWPVQVASVSRDADPHLLAERERAGLGFRPELRGEWRSAEDAFLWWRRQIEALGVFCFQMPLDCGDIRGASLWLRGRYPFILVNHHEAEAATGRQFTLLHEYAHLLTDRDGLVCDFRGAEPATGVEPFANRFAARMLVSLEEMRTELTRTGENRYCADRSDTTLDKIRERLFISRDVVAITLQEMDWAPADFYQKKRARWDLRRPFGRGSKGGSRPLKERALRKLGFSLIHVLTRAAEQGAVSLLDVADVMGTKVERVESILSKVGGGGTPEKPK